MRHARWTAPLVGLALVAALAAPGGASQARAASTQSIVNAAVLSKSDVPSNYTSKKQADSLGKALKTVSACKALSSAVDAANKNSTRRLSPEFSDPSTQAGLTTADDVVNVFKNPSNAQKLLAAFQTGSASTCFEKAFQKAIAKSAKGFQTSVTLTPINNLQGVGDGAVGFQGSVNLTGKGQSLTLIIDLVGVQVGRAFLGFSFANPDTTIPNGLGIINSVVDRTKTAVGA